MTPVPLPGSRTRSVALPASSLVQWTPLSMLRQTPPSPLVADTAA